MTDPALFTPKGNSVIIAARHGYRDNALPRLGRAVRMFEYTPPQCKPGQTRELQSNWALSATIAGDYATVARNGPWTAAESRSALSGNLPGGLRPGAPPLRARVTWNDGALGASVDFDTHAGQSFVLPATTHASFDILMPDTLEFGANVSQGEDIAGQSPPVQNINVCRLSASMAWVQPNNFPESLRLTDWFSLVPDSSGGDPPFPPGTLFVPLPKYARRVQWEFAPSNLADPASASARWALWSQGTALGIGGPVVPDGELQVVPGNCAGLWLIGDTQFTVNVNVMWELQV